MVVLFNGGLKFTKGTAQDDPNVSRYFYEANDYAESIINAINDGTICISFKTMVSFNGDKTIKI